MSENKDLATHVGTVIFFKNTYGFIAWSKDGSPQADLFVHYSDIAQDKGYKTLQKDAIVSFQIGLNHRGQPKAINVTVLNKK